MPKRIVSILVFGFLLTGCSSEPTYTPTMQDCLEQGEFKYMGECVSYDRIPEEDVESIWWEVADTIAEREGITREEALELMLETIEGYGG
jgi:PBP1b-binding outer membrane lipoprotein LpoB